MDNIKSRVKIVQPENELLDIVNINKPFILYFTASWCGPCRMVSPLYQMLSTKHTDIDFFKVDIDECEEMSSDFNINSVPCFHVFKKQRIIRYNYRCKYRKIRKSY